MPGITEFADQAIQLITDSRDHWISFLKTASRMYKYRFYDSLFIHIQRPHATAVATKEIWNRLGRTVDESAKIALVDDSNANLRYKYSYDVSATKGNPIPKLWELKKQDTAKVIKQFVSNYNVPHSDRLEMKMHKAVYQAVSEYCNSHADEFISTLQNDTNRIEQIMLFIAESSMYAVYSRCGFSLDGFDNRYFTALSAIKEKEVAVLAGTAVSEVSGEILRSIEQSVKAIEKEKNHNERKKQHEQAEHEQSKSERQSRKSVDRQIRETSENLSERTSSVGIQQSDPVREVDGTPDKSGQTVLGENGSPTEATTGERPITADNGHDGTDNAQTDDIRHSGRNRTKRNGIPDGQLTLFDTPQEKADDPSGSSAFLRSQPFSKSSNTEIPNYSISQEVIDEVLRLGSNQDKSKLRICAQVMKNKESEDNVSFLKSEYKEGGKGIIIDGNRISVWFNENGFTLAKGDTALNARNSTQLSWEQADKRIKELLEQGLYMPQDELDIAMDNEYMEVAESLWRLNGDTKYEIFDDMVSINFSEQKKYIAGLLSHTDSLKDVVDKLTVFTNEYEKNPDILRFPYHKPKKLLQRVLDLQSDKVNFASEKTFEAPDIFITQDEIDSAFKQGSGIYQGKYRIYSFFLEEHTEKEKRDFIKKEYGTTYGSHQGNWSEEHTPKGVVFKRYDQEQVFDTVTLTWNKVSKRIDELISSDRYFDSDKENHIKYLEEQKALEDRTKLANEFNEVIYEYTDIKDNADTDLNRYYLSGCADAYIDGEPKMYRRVGRGDEILPMMKDALNVIINSETYLSEKARLILKRLDGNEAENPNVIDGNAQESKELDELTFERSENDIFREYSNRFIREIFKDETYLNACKNSDEQNTKDECNSAIDRMALMNIDDTEFYNLYGDNNGFKEKLVDYVFQKTYLDLKKKIDIALNPRKRKNIYELNYDKVERLAKDVLTGEIEYVKLTADGFMDLHIQSYSDNTISIAHYYEQNGDSMADPEMTFRVDHENRTIEALTYRQDGLGLYQEVYPSEGKYIPKLKKELNNFFKDWLKNISDQRFSVSKKKNSSEQEKEDINTSDQQYDLMYGHLGNGVTVWNKHKEVNGDYETVAHIGADRQVTFYDQELPQKLKDEINHFALTGDMNVSATQNFSVFDVPPQNEQEKKEVDTNLEENEQNDDISLFNYQITDMDIGRGSAKPKFRSNVVAIRLLKQIESENRLATKEEQEILAYYVGWGGLSEAFDDTKGIWSREYAELKELLTDEEYKAARKSTLNAHYTTPSVIQTIYKAIENAGFTKGKILEPAMGVGNFFGCIPDSLQSSKLFGIEIDSITGRIAKQLYQKADIRIQGFEKTDFPDNYFDVVIGNVPFGDYQVHDPKYNKHSFLIHDYFIAKALDHTRPGGVVAVITSKGTMDKQNPSVRKYIAQRAELVGTIRLPNDTFKANAGTSVTTDILFLQKRERAVDIEPDWVHLGQTEDGIAVNSYYADNPHMLLGKMTTESTQYGHDTTLAPIKSKRLEDQLEEAVQNIDFTIPEYESAEAEEDQDTIPADPNVKNYCYTIHNNHIYYRENSVMSKCDISGLPEQRLRGLIEVKKTVRKLIDYQVSDYPDEDILKARDNLNSVYDRFVGKYGNIHERGNNLVFRDDADYPLLLSLENIDKEGNAHKTDMFYKRTIRQKEKITHVDTASDALAVSLNERGYVDIPFMASLSNKTPDEIVNSLEGVLFADPLKYVEGEYTGFETADEYLSGNVRLKLEIAKLEAKENPLFKANVKALQLIQPKDLEAFEIEAPLGATWIPLEDYKDFIDELLKTPDGYKDKMKLNYNRFTGSWFIEHKTLNNRGVLSTATYGTERANAYDIIEDSLNLRDTRVYDYKENEKGNKVAVINQDETFAARQKQEQIKDKFREWIFDDPDRRARLVKLYNERFNSVRLRSFDGSHLTFPSMNPEKKLRDYQVNAVARAIYGGNTLLAHAVGAGKTYEMVAAAMELKRLKLANKNLFVVPNHLIEQWGAEFLELYPSANILLATDRDFEMANRKKFCARIATGEYDAVIMGHSSFGKIPVSDERAESMINKQIEDITEGISELDPDNERYSIKQLELLKKRLETRLEKLLGADKKDNVLTFEELGVDNIFVDESQNFKNLFAFTKMSNVAGVQQTDAKKSTDLYMKCQYLNELSDGRGVVFATGTPITNSIVELFTIQRYLQHSELQRLGLSHFDNWASTFGETVTKLELAPEGNGYRPKTRLAKFHNLPELITTFKGVADIITSDMLDIPRPRLAGGKVHTEVTKPTKTQKGLIEYLGERTDAVRDKKVDRTVDNMLCITNDGRMIALDQRVFDPNLPDDPDSKINVCINKILNVWKETQESRSAQIIFCDISTPSKKRSFNVYDDIKKKLIQKDVPAEEIAFIHDAKTDKQKEKLFEKVRNGSIRVLIGSTFKCGAGTNIQDKLIALHHLDVPWRPSDNEQREGRILRYGNENPEVQIDRYVTEGTFDAYSWQLLEHKQRFISQIMTSDDIPRTMDDMDTATLTCAEVKALASGNPLIKEKIDVDLEVHKLKSLKASYNKQKYSLQDKVNITYPKRIKAEEQTVENLKKDLEYRNRHKSEDFEIKIGNRLLTDKEAAGERLILLAKEYGHSDEEKQIGEYKGFKLFASYDRYKGVNTLVLQNCGKHIADMGESGIGNISRLDNALKSMGERFKQCENQIKDLKEQMEEAQRELAQPFKLEDELKEKMNRQAELNKALDLNKKEDVIVDDEENTDEISEYEAQEEREI